MKKLIVSKAVKEKIPQDLIKEIYRLIVACQLQRLYINLFYFLIVKVLLLLILYLLAISTIHFTFLKNLI